MQNNKVFDSGQRASLQVLNQMLSSQTGTAASMTTMTWPGPGSNGISTQVFNDIVIAVTTLIALIVLAVSLGLSSAETRATSVRARGHWLKQSCACERPLMADPWKKRHARF